MTKLQRTIKAARLRARGAPNLARDLAPLLHLTKEAEVLLLRRQLEHWEQGTRRPPGYFEPWLVARCAEVTASDHPVASSPA